MRPTRLAPTVLLFAVLMPSHHGGTRLAARPMARGAIDRPAVDTAPLAAVTTLLDIDRAFSKTGSDLSMRSALDAMFAAVMDSNDAVLMGGLDDPQFIVGSANIVRTVPPVHGDQPATVTRGADTALVASSGDQSALGALERRPSAKSTTGKPLRSKYRARVQRFMRWRCRSVECRFKI